MGDFSGKIDVEKLISFSDDLVAVLKDQRDINNLSHCLQQSHSLKSSCDAEFNDSKTLIEGLCLIILNLICNFFFVDLIGFSNLEQIMRKRQKNARRKRRRRKRKLFPMPTWRFWSRSWNWSFKKKLLLRRSSDKYFT